MVPIVEIPRATSNLSSSLLTQKCHSDIVINDKQFICCESSSEKCFNSILCNDGCHPYSANSSVSFIVASQFLNRKKEIMGWAGPSANSSALSNFCCQLINWSAILHQMTASLPSPAPFHICEPINDRYKEWSFNEKPSLIYTRLLAFLNFCFHIHI